MNIGMLWFDNDPETALSAKIDRAVRYYRDKYKLAPNQCFVNPAMLNGSDVEAPLKVEADPAILPNHLWIGFNGDLKPPPSSA